MYLNILYYSDIWGPGSSVGIATELRAGRSWIEYRRGRDLPPVQTGPGSRPASCKMGTGSFPGIKYGRDVLLTTHPLLVPRSWSYATTHPLGHTGPVTRSLYLYSDILLCLFFPFYAPRVFLTHLTQRVLIVYTVHGKGTCTQLTT